MPAKCLTVMTCFKRVNSEKKQNLPQIISHFETNTNHMAFWQADAFCRGPAHAAQLCIAHCLQWPGSVPWAPGGAVWPKEAGVPLQTSVTRPLVLCFGSFPDQECCYETGKIQWRLKKMAGVPVQWEEVEGVEVVQSITWKRTAIKLMVPNSSQ